MTVFNKSFSFSTVPCHPLAYSFLSITSSLQPSLLIPGLPLPRIPVTRSVKESHLKATDYMKPLLCLEVKLRSERFGGSNQNTILREMKSGSREFKEYTHTHTHTHLSLISVFFSPNSIMSLPSNKRLDRLVFIFSRSFAFIYHLFSFLGVSGACIMISFSSKSYKWRCSVITLSGR